MLFLEIMRDIITQKSENTFTVHVYRHNMSQSTKK